MPGISTHVLDLTSGQPAAGVGITLERRGATDEWIEIATSVTDADGRVTDVAGPVVPGRGVFRIRFATGDYFQAAGIRTFYPEVSVIFSIDDASRHHHVPLLLGPFGYSTYRGS